jgi:hypothetical protein
VLLVPNNVPETDRAGVGDTASQALLVVARFLVGVAEVIDDAPGFG